MSEAINQSIELLVKTVPNESRKAEYQRLTSEIGQGIANIRESFIDIARKLYIVHEKELYRLDGYKNIYDYASDKFKVSRGTTSDFINLVKNLMVFDSSSETYKLDDCWKGYNTSQLLEIRKMPPGMRGRVSPQMSVRELKDMRLSEKQGKQEGQEKQGAVPQQIDATIVLYSCADAATFHKEIKDIVKKVSEYCGGEFVVIARPPVHVETVENPVMLAGSEGGHNE